MTFKWVASAGLLAALLIPGVAQAQTSDDNYPPGGERSLDVEAFDAFCQDDAPYIRYSITTVGFPATGLTATLILTDINGDPIDTLENMPLEGSFLYPGTEIDGKGDPIDWPGWIYENGAWREQSVDDPGSDAILRLGINIRVVVDSVTGFVDPAVTYPEANPHCGPAGVSPSGGTNPTAVSAARTTLPSTGTNTTTTILQIGALFAVGGGLLAVGARRRKSAPAS